MSDKKVNFTHFNNQPPYFDAYYVYQAFAAPVNYTTFVQVFPASKWPLDICHRKLVLL